MYVETSANKNAIKILPPTIKKNEYSCSSDVYGIMSPYIIDPIKHSANIKKLK
jgi:hypothetical protein